MKMIFRFSAIVAMLSMMATATITTSCSDDDDPKQEHPITKTFTVNMGGANSKYGSFLSISSEKAYTTNELGEGKDVEIVFDGTTFKSATESENLTVKANGLSAEITRLEDGSFGYTTSNGCTGTIKVEGELGDAAKTYVVFVTKHSVK